jgi:hypothetical protein
MNAQILSFTPSLVSTAFVFISVIFLTVGLPGSRGRNRFMKQRNPLTNLTPCHFFLYFKTRSRISRRNVLRSASLFAFNPFKPAMLATVLAQSTPSRSANSSQRSSAMTSMRLDTERFSSSARALSFCFVSSGSVMFNFGFRLFVFLRGFIAIKKFQNLSLQSAADPHTMRLLFAFLT